MKLTYPKTGDYQPDTQAIYEVCREMILSREQGKEGWEDIQEARVGDGRYLISLYETESHTISGGSICSVMWRSWIRRRCSLTPARFCC